MKRVQLLTKFTIAATMMMMAITAVAASTASKADTIVYNKKERVCVHSKEKCTDDFMNMTYDSSSSYSNTSDSGSDSSSSSSSSEEHPGRVFCPFPLYCNRDNGKCVSDNTGISCRRDSDCMTRPDFYGSGLLYCDVNKCRKRYNYGDKCHRSSDCAGGMSCVNHHCVGREEGESCTEPLEYSEKIFAHVTGYTCAKGLACVDKICVKKIPENGNCEKIPCAAGLTCNNKTCIKRHSLKKGMPCSVNKNVF